jgi:hypothetical protein
VMTGEQCLLSPAGRITATRKPSLGGILDSDLNNFSSASHRDQM